MRKCFLFLAVVFTFFLVACSLFNSSNGNGGISLSLPDNSKRSVTSEGSLVAEGVSYYVVRLRKDGEVEQEEKASPGSTITIDGLYPGEYTVAILGVDSDGIVQVYGRSPSVEVRPGETSATSLSLSLVNEMTLRFRFYFFDSNGEYIYPVSDDANFSITARGAGTSHSYSVSTWLDEGMAAFYLFYTEGSDTCVPRSVRNFLEPGISYRFSVTASDAEWSNSYYGYSDYVIENGENIVQVNLK